MDKKEVPTFEEIMENRREQSESFVEFLHGVVGTVEKWLDVGLAEYQNRVVYQEALLLIMTELGVNTFEVSKDAVDKVRDTYVGKRVHVVNEVNEDGSRTVKLSVSELEEND